MTSGLRTFDTNDDGSASKYTTLNTTTLRNKLQQHYYYIATQLQMRYTQQND